MLTSNGKEYGTWQRWQQASMFEKKGTYVPKKGTEKVPVEEHGLHLNWLYSIAQDYITYPIITLNPSTATWLYMILKLWTPPKRRHKHLFEEHLFVWQLFPRLMQKTSVDSHRNQPSNPTGPVYPRRFPLNCPPCNDERRTEGILLDMYKDASIGLAEHPPGTREEQRRPVVI